MAMIIDLSKPETFNSFRVEAGPHMTSFNTTKDMDAFEVRERIIYALDAMLGINIEKVLDQ